MNNETNMAAGWLEGFHKARVQEMVDQICSDHLEDGLSVAYVAEYLERFTMANMPYTLIFSEKSLQRVDFEELARYFIKGGS